MTEPRSIAAEDAARAPDPATPADETSIDAEVGAEGSPSTLGQAYLVCNRDAGVEVFAIKKDESLVVGRAPNAAIHVDSPRVSRAHARVVFGERGLSVEDLGSRNGTRVNGDVLRSSRVKVTGGDVVKVGPLEIVIARASPDEPRAVEASRAGGEADEELEAEGVVVADPAMVTLFRVLRRLAPSSSTVLILGETGSGKEVVAEQIHRLSPRAGRPFVRLNCASLPDALLESELFGHERGAFTGAERQRAGYFEASHGGTLLLDEIGEIPLPLQAKLLRVLEAGRVTRLGATADRAVDVRVLCATHRDLAEEVKRGRFRQDLYYRVSTFTLKVPPLRERPTEIKLLADRMGRKLAAKMELPFAVVTPRASARLLAHGWPGNVRELRNVMEHAVVMANGGPIEPEHLPEALGGPAEPPVAPAIRSQLADVERASIEAALAAEGNNRTHAAKRLGMSRRALIYKMIKYGLRE